MSIFTHWDGMTEADLKEQDAAYWTRTAGGSIGYLLDRYSTDPCAVGHLLAELFEPYEVRIRAATLRKRLPRALKLVEEWGRRTGQEKAIKAWQRDYSDFVAFCEAKEKEAGRPVSFFAQR